jgi:hypothetical protein
MNPLWIAPPPGAQPDGPGRPSSREALEDHHRRLLEQRSLRLAQLSGLGVDAGPPGGSGARQALAIAARSAVREIDRALDRIDAGTYGVCVTCRSDIPPPRLAALPMAPHCAACDLNEQNCRISRVTGSLS